MRYVAAIVWLLCGVVGFFGFVVTMTDTPNGAPQQAVQGIYACLCIIGPYCVARGVEQFLRLVAPKHFPLPAVPQEKWD